MQNTHLHGVVTEEMRDMGPGDEGHEASTSSTAPTKVSQEDHFSVRVRV